MPTREHGACDYAGPHSCCRRRVRYVRHGGPACCRARGLRLSGVHTGKQNTSQAHAAFRTLSLTGCSTPSAPMRLHAPQPVVRLEALLEGSNSSPRVSCPRPGKVYRNAHNAAGLAGRTFPGNKLTTFTPSASLRVSPQMCARVHALLWVTPEPRGQPGPRRVACLTLENSTVSASSPCKPKKDIYYWYNGFQQKAHGQDCKVARAGGVLRFALCWRTDWGPPTCGHGCPGPPPPTPPPEAAPAGTVPYAPKLPRQPLAEERAVDPGLEGLAGVGHSGWSCDCCSRVLKVPHPTTPPRDWDAAGVERGWLCIPNRLWAQGPPLVFGARCVGEAAHPGDRALQGFRRPCGPMFKSTTDNQAGVSC